MGMYQKSPLYVNIYMNTFFVFAHHEVAALSRLPKNICLFFKRALSNRLYSKKFVQIITALSNFIISISSLAVWGGYGQ